MGHWRRTILDYIRQFARLTHTTLDPSRKVYVEYANEIWNTAFSSGTWVEQQGQAAWPNSPDSAYTKRINWYGKRTAETCDLWKSEWAGDASRVVCVLAAQAANPWTANAALNCALWSLAPCQAHGIQAVAVAPYFGYYLGSVSNGPALAAWTANADGGLFMHFLSVGQYSLYGSWGALENLGQTTSSKYGALIRYIAMNPQ